MCFLSNVDAEPVLRSIIIECDKNKAEHKRFLKRQESEGKILADLHAELKAQLSVAPPKKTNEKLCSRLRGKIEKQAAFCETVRIAVRDANKTVLRESDHLNQRIASALSQTAQAAEPEITQNLKRAVEDYVTCLVAQNRGFMAAQTAVEDLVEGRSVIDMAEQRIESANERLIKAANGAG